MLADLNEYQEKAVRTLKRGDCLLDDVLHCVLGMVGEAGEVSEIINETPEEVVKEVGDSMWYAAVLSHVLSLRLEELKDEAIHALGSRGTMLFSSLAPEDRAHIWAGRMADRVKKSCFYGKTLDLSSLKNELVQYWACMEEHCYLLDVPILEVATKNILKLEARYPAGSFDADKAINRNHEAEDAAMKGVS